MENKDLKLTGSPTVPASPGSPSIPGLPYNGANRECQLNLTTERPNVCHAFILFF